MCFVFPEPSKVENVTTTDIYPFNAHIVWNSPCFDNGPLIGYVITLHDDSDGETEYFTNDTVVNTYSIDVQPYKNYTVVVQALNAEGLSVNSTNSTVNFQAPITSKFCHQ